MKPRNAVRVLTTAGASIALCIIAAPAHATGAGPASAASLPASVICPANDMCLQRTNGTTVLVPSGQSRSFDTPLQTDLIENNTRLYYCVETGFITSLDVPPGGVISGTRIVHGATPGPVCPG